MDLHVRHAGKWSSVVDYCIVGVENHGLIGRLKVMINDE